MTRGGRAVVKVAVILPAAGTSSRFGGPVKKPFVTLAGTPVWRRAVELFCRRPDVVAVLLVLHPDDEAEFRAKHGGELLFLYENVTLVTGGAERSESVANALRHVPPAADLVAVHDCVRPLTPAAVIDAVFAKAAATGAALAAVPLADTLKRVDPATGRVTATVPRAGLWQAQTPQVFRRDWLTAAYADRATWRPAVTDDAQVMEAAGHPVAVVVGSGRNFKITTNEDLATAEVMLAERAVAKEPEAGRFRDDEGAGW